MERSVTPNDRRSQTAAGDKRNRPSVSPSRSVIVMLTHAGDLVWSGQDLRPDVARLRPGATEYEWSRTVPAAHVPALLAALGGTPHDNVVALVAASFDTDVELEEFATKAGIPTEFDSWVSTNDD
jgi:hypothetical protein